MGEKYRPVQGLFARFEEQLMMARHKDFDDSYSCTHFPWADEESSWHPPTFSSRFFNEETPPTPKLVHIQMTIPLKLSFSTTKSNIPQQPLHQNPFSRLDQRQQINTHHSQIPNPKSIPIPPLTPLPKRPYRNRQPQHHRYHIPLRRRPPQPQRSNTPYNHRHRNRPPRRRIPHHQRHRLAVPRRVTPLVVHVLRLHGAEFYTRFNDGPPA